MFAYCAGNPVRYSDPSGNFLIEALIVEVGTGWAITIVIGGITIISGAVYASVEALVNWFSKLWYRPFAQVTYVQEENQEEETVPDVTYPGDDPTKAPDGYEWRGPDEQGGKRGGYANPNGKDSWHPDLDHPDGVDPHWDYNDGLGHKWRVFPDRIEFVRK